MSEFKVHVLGAGSAKPTLQHSPSCTVLDVRGNLFMIDCGEGAQQQMLRMGLKFTRLGHIFLTHLHGDHVLGLPGLLSTLSLQERGGEVHIYTFREGVDLLSRMMDFFGGKMSYKLVFHEIKVEEATVYEDNVIRLRTLPLRHKVPCVGYVVEEKPKPRHIDRAACDYHGVPVFRMNALRAGADFVKEDGTVVPNERLTLPPTPSVSYAHIGDTSFLPELASKIGPVDLLYHETTYTKQFAKDARERGHSTAAQAAQMAKACGAKRLLTGHYSSRFRTEDEILSEARAIFPDVIHGREGLTVNL